MFAPSDVFWLLLFFLVSTGKSWHLEDLFILFGFVCPHWPDSLGRFGLLSFGLVWFGLVTDPETPLGVSGQRVGRC